MKTEKLIIENRTTKSMYFILGHIRNVVNNGRISNSGKEYTYASTFNDGICIYSVKNKKSDKLIVTYREDLDEFKPQ